MLQNAFIGLQLLPVFKLDHCNHKNLNEEYILWAWVVGDSGCVLNCTTGTNVEASEKFERRNNFTGESQK